MTPALWFAAVAVVLPYAVHLVVMVARARLSPDRRSPRALSAELTGWGKRAWAAELNAFEAALPGAVVFIIAHLAQVESAWVWALGLGWTAARIGHFGAYLSDIPTLRSAMFGLANLCLIGLVIVAAR
jgi:uncharacterized MAPEG superfamily protein